MGLPNRLSLTILVLTLAKPGLFTVYNLPRAVLLGEVMPASIRRCKAMGYKEKWPKVFRTKGGRQAGQRGGTFCVCDWYPERIRSLQVLLPEVTSSVLKIRFLDTSTRKRSSDSLIGSVPWEGSACLLKTAIPAFKPQKSPTENKWIGFPSSTISSSLVRLLWMNSSHSEKPLRNDKNNILFSRWGDRAATTICHIAKPATHSTLKNAMKNHERTDVEGLVVVRSSSKKPCICKQDSSNCLKSCREILLWKS